MPIKKERIIIRVKKSAEGDAMNAAFQKATKEAKKAAFKVRTTIMIEKDGWLVMVNKSGRVVRKVKKVDLIELPAA